MSSQSDTVVVPMIAGTSSDYAAPQLLELGDVRDLTLGGTPGTGDSGTSTTQDWPVGSGGRAPRG